MGQTLTHGVYLPSEGERNCYSGLASNWRLLDGAIGTVAAHTTAIAEKAPLVHTHTVSQITDFPVYGTTAGTICEGNDSRLSDARTPVAHTHTKADITDLFNSANTWTSLNTYTGMILLNSSSDVAEQFKQKLPKDVSVSTDALVRFNTLTDSEDHNVIVEALGHWANYVSKSVTLKYKNDSTKQGTIDFRLDSNGYGVYYPLTPFECNLGNAGNQWKSVYAQTYYYNGTQWGLDQSNEWTGNNVFSGDSVPTLKVKNTSLDISSLPASNLGIQIGYLDKNNVVVGGWNYIKGPDGTTRLYCELATKNSNNQEIRRTLRIDTDQNGVNWNFYSSADINLGTSTNKWKSFNGINPGALSLPNLASDGYIDLSDHISANTEYLYTPVYDGWLALYCQTTGFHAENAVGIFNREDATSYRWANSVTSSINLLRYGTYHGSIILPVRAGIQYGCWVVVNSSTPLATSTLFFYKAKGNV